MSSITVRSFHGATIRTHFIDNREDAMRTAFNEADGSGLYVSIRYTPAPR